MKRWILKIGKAIALLCLLLMTAWAALAVYYSPLPAALRPWLAGLYCCGNLYLLIRGNRFRYGWALPFASFAAVLAWWLAIPPSNNRDWQADSATLAWADITGNKVTIHNIRNCDYRTETDFTCHYYDKTFDLDRLKTVDGYLVYWGSPNIAHTMMSFNFEGEGTVCFSIETRKEKGEAYSTIKGFFRQYELMYVVADERDLVRLRTNYRENGRGEDVYLYRFDATPEFARNVFLSYLASVNRLKNHPQWYNALTSNCTTSILQHTMPYNPNDRFDWRYVVNGYLDEMLYEMKNVDTSLPFAELKKRSRINARAQAADKAPDFSLRIREGLPGM